MFSSHSTARRPAPRLAHGATLLLAATLLGAPPARAQTVHYGVMEDSVRAALARQWSDDSAQVERAYCIARARIVVHPVSPSALDSIFRVTAVRPADAHEAGLNHMEFECPRGTPELHTHTPATCVGEDARWCVAGGPLAYSCQPSREDLEKLARRGDQFGIVQCDRNAFRFYYPSE